MINIHEAKDILFDLVVGCSVAHSALPPWDAEPFKPFPTFQKYYKVFIYLLGYIAINARSTIYKQISTQTIGGINESVVNAQGPKES